MQKKLLGTLLAMCMLFGMLMAFPTAAADVVEISEPEQIFKLMNGDSEFPLSGSYKLKDNINLAEYSGELPQKPIGTASNPFSGTFNGNGHIISGIEITGTTYVGLFGKLTGTVQNLTAKGNITGTGNYLGGIVGCATDSAVVAYCVNECVVTGGASSQNVGGIAGRGEGNASFSYCWNKESVTTYKQAGGIVGGIVNNVVISACQNEGSVKTLITNKTANIGGVVGYVGGSNNRVTNCRNTGSVTAGTEASRVGGIAGAVTASKAEITYCYSDATITVATADNVGSISGFCSGSVLNCYYDADKALTNDMSEMAYKVAEHFDQLNLGSA